MPEQVWELASAPLELGSGNLIEKMIGPKGARLGGLLSVVAVNVMAETSVLLLVMQEGKIARRSMWSSTHNNRTRTSTSA